MEAKQLHPDHMELKTMIAYLADCRKRVANGEKGRVVQHISICVRRLEKVRTNLDKLLVARKHMWHRDNTRDRLEQVRAVMAAISYYEGLIEG